MGVGLALTSHAISFLVNAYFLVMAYHVFSGFKTRGWTYWGGEWAFLTQINHVFETLFFAFVLALDIKLLVRHPKSNARGKPILQLGFLDTTANSFFTVLFVFSSLVGICFWGLYFLDRDLILPASLGNVYPLDLNLFQHGFTMLLIWVELFLVEKSNSGSVLQDIVRITVVGIAYLGWTAIIVFKNKGLWPYPFQTDLPLIGHVLFYGLAFFIMLLLIVTKRVLVYVWWDERRNRKKEQ